MITAQMLKDKLYARPFRPFRIDMSDGKSYWVPSWGNGLVKKSGIEVGTKFDKDGFAISTTFCPLLQITQIEELDAAKS